MDEISVKWMEKYNLAKQYFEENGNLLPNKNKKFYSKELAYWIVRERKNRKYKTDYNPEKIKLLDEIKMKWVLDKNDSDVQESIKSSHVREEKWNENYQLAKMYYSKYGNLLVSRTDEKYKKLNIFIRHERTKFKKSDYDKEHKKKLDEIGMVWTDTRTALRNTKVTEENNCETYCKTNGLEYILKEWNDERKPTEIKWNSTSENDRIKFKCEFCGHEWETKIYNRTKKLQNCRKCSTKAKSTAESVLKFYFSKKTKIEQSYQPDWLNKKEIDIFMPDLNIGIEYDGQRYHTEKEIGDDLEKSKICKENGVKLYRIREPKCPKLKDKNATIFYRSKTNWMDDDLKEIVEKIYFQIFQENIEIDIVNDSVEILNTRRFDKIKNSIEEKNPTLASYWNYEKNKNLKPSMFTCGQGVHVWWKCNKCEYEWKAAIYSVKNSVKNGYNGCPCCSGRVTVTGKNDFYTMALKNDKEYLIKEFEEAKKCGKNKNIDLRKIYYNSNKKEDRKIWWKCLECGNEWPSSPLNRNTCNCPKCSHKKGGEKQKIASYEESIAFLYPEIAKLVYDKEKNDPTKIFPKSESEILFNCDNGKDHIPYPMKVRQKTNKNSQCLICGNKMLAKGFNDVASKYPEIVKLWDYDKNNSIEVLKNAKWNIEKQGEFIPENIIDKTNNTFKVCFVDESEPISLNAKINRLLPKINKDEVINEKKEKEWRKQYDALAKYLEENSLSIDDIKKRDETILYEGASKLGTWIYTQKKKLKNDDYNKPKYKDRVSLLEKIGLSIKN